MCGIGAKRKAVGWGGWPRPLTRAMDRSDRSEAYLETSPEHAVKIQRVLCAVDFSEFSRRAFRYAAGMARHFGARLFVQHTIPDGFPEFAAERDREAMEAAIRVARQEARRKIQRVARQAGTREEEIRVILNGGDIRKLILETVLTEKIDLLVMGTHSRKGLSRLVMGSVAEHVLDAAACPVLVVNRTAREMVELHQPDPVHIRTILLATDFSRNSDRALQVSLRWAQEWGAKLVVFHAVDSEPPETEDMVDLLPEYNRSFERRLAEAGEKIRMLVPRAAEANFDIGYEVRHGVAREVIPEMAEQMHADLIVMGSHWLGGSTMAWGSTTSGVVRNGR